MKCSVQWCHEVGHGRAGEGVKVMRREGGKKA